MSSFVRKYGRSPGITQGPARTRRGATRLRLSGATVPDSHGQGIRRGEPFPSQGTPCGARQRTGSACPVHGVRVAWGAGVWGRNGFDSDAERCVASRRGSGRRTTRCNMNCERQRRTDLAPKGSVGPCLGSRCKCSSEGRHNTLARTVALSGGRTSARNIIHQAMRSLRRLGNDAPHVDPLSWDRPATLVDAHRDVLLDPGSIPGASSKTWEVCKLTLVEAPRVPRRACPRVVHAGPTSRQKHVRPEEPSYGRPLLGAGSPASGRRGAHGSSAAVARVPWAHQVAGSIPASHILGPTANRIAKASKMLRREPSISGSSGRNPARKATCQRVPLGGRIPPGAGMEWRPCAAHILCFHRSVTRNARFQLTCNWGATVSIPSDSPCRLWVHPSWEPPSKTLFMGPWLIWESAAPARRR